MIKKFLLLSLIFLLIFSFLIYFNSLQAQKALENNQPSELSISLSQPLQKSSSTTPTTFTWQVDAPSDFVTPFTTIYYDYISSPSALTKTDSPLAVGYAHHFSDFQTGQFSLPDTFSVSQQFLPGTIFYRAYALVGKDNLWTPEYKLIVTP